MFCTLYENIFMFRFQTIISSFSGVIFLISCNTTPKVKDEQKEVSTDTVKTVTGQTVSFPAPFATKSVTNYCDVIGWTIGKKPLAPTGFSVSLFADSLDNPRWIYVAKNGDIFVAESNTIGGLLMEAKSKITGKSKSGNSAKSANRITLLRDTNNDGIPDFRKVFLTGMNQPFGMLIIGNRFYVGNTDGIIAFPYSYGQTQISAKGKKIISLPAGGYNNHWTRNIITNNDSTKIFVTVGSGSNVAEHGIENEVRRADILEFNPDGTNEKIYASGLRNPQGMDWAPGSQTLWVAVNERDELGDDLVPDYITSVKEGGFYGWPYSYWGQHEDPRMKDKQRPDLVQKAIVPDVSMNAHTASLGLAFDKGHLFPDKYKGGAFIGQHGSWNRSTLSGYEVAFVPFENGRPTGPVEPFLTGFIADSTEKKVYGRPVGVAFIKSGGLLVADDVSNKIWLVSPTTK
jgi:glucose/arabinose dehydrogenase